MIAQEVKLSDTATDIAVPAPNEVAQEVPKAETFSLDYVQGLRQEAAKYRTEKNEAVAAAKSELESQFESKLTEKDSFAEQLKQELTARELELVKLKAILSADFPSSDVLEVASLVQGSDEESISESVKRVKSLIGKIPTRDRPVDPSQGSGNHLPLNGDPLLETIKRMVGA